MQSHISPSATPEDEPAEPIFASIGKKKLFIMSIASIWLYNLYWDWKNWTIVKQRTGQKINPVCIVRKYSRALLLALYLPGLLVELILFYYTHTRILLVRFVDLHTPSHDHC